MHDCDKSPSHKQLNKYFKMSIRENKIEHYRKIYKRHCMVRNKAVKHIGGKSLFESPEQLLQFLKHHSETLAQKMLESRNLLLTSILDTTEPYRNRMERIVSMKRVLWLVNMLSLLASFVVPWDVYLIFFEKGRDILRNVFTGSNRVLAALYLYIILNVMKETKSYYFESIGQMINYIPMVFTREDMLRIGILEYFGTDEMGRAYVSQEVIENTEISVLLIIVGKTINLLEYILEKYNLLEKAKMMLNSIEHE